jgi:hypothetical protein
MPEPGDPTVDGSPPTTPPAAPPARPALPPEASLPSLPPPTDESTLTGGDWPAQAADTIVDLVDQVRAKTVVPATRGARGAVYGLLALILGSTIVVLLYIAVVRALTELFEWAFPWGGVWVTYLLFGLVCLITGTLLFRKRYPPSTPTR